MKAFETLDAEVLGVSVDSIWSHKAYAEKMGIKYSLLADFHPRGAASEKYGVYLADKGITGRAIAIVNKAGKVAWFKNYDIPVVPDLKEVAAALGQVKRLRRKERSPRWHRNTEQRKAAATRSGPAFLCLLFCREIVANNRTALVTNLTDQGYAVGSRVPAHSDQIG